MFFRVEGLSLVIVVNVLHFGDLVVGLDVFRCLSIFVFYLSCILITVILFNFESRSIIFLAALMKYLWNVKVALNWMGTRLDWECGIWLLLRMARNHTIGLASAELDLTVIFAVISYHQRLCLSKSDDGEGGANWLSFWFIVFIETLLRRLRLQNLTLARLKHTFPNLLLVMSGHFHFTRLFGPHIL